MGDPRDPAPELQVPSVAGWPVGTALFLSGAAALAYEITWTRRLEVVLGTSAYATAAVFAAYMGGLGMGAAIFGARAARAARPLRGYAALEVGAAACALALPLALRLLDALYLAAGGGAAFPPAIGLLLRLVISLIALGPATILLGGTLPYAVAAVGAAGGGRATGRLYAANTAGAVAGVLAAGFWAVPALGVFATTWLAAGASAAAAGIALVQDRLSFTVSRLSSGKGTGAERQTTSDKRETMSGAGILAAAAAAGAAALALEVAWVRYFACAFGSSTYALATVLAAVLAGLAGGSALAARLLPARAPGALLAAAQAGVALGAALMLLAPEEPFRAVAWAVVRWDEDLGTLFAFRGLVAVLAIGLPCLAMGAVFPLAVAAHVAARGVPEPRAVGRVTAANTLGALAGSLGAGFILVPGWGTRATVAGALLLAAAAGGLGTALAGRPAPRALRAATAAISIAAAATVFATPAWDPSVLTSAPYLRVAGGSARSGPLGFRRAGDIVFARDGLCCFVAVVRDDSGNLYLQVNGKTDASTDPADVSTQLLLGHLPCLFHPAPRRAFVLGLGSGATTAAILRHPVEQVVAVEIEPAVREAARLFGALHGEDGRALEDPRVRHVLEDGRHALAAGEARYDVIVSEPSNPWLAGVSSLFTEGFYALCRSRLAPGGIFCGWLPLYDFTPDDARIAFGAVRSAFPHVWVFVPNGEADALLVASGTPLGAENVLAGAESRPGVLEDLLRARLAGAEDLLSWRALAGEALDAFVRGAERNTDDRPVLEFRIPWTVRRGRAGSVLEAIAERAQDGRFREKFRKP